jgi:hypothetical protein
LDGSAHSAAHSENAVTKSVAEFGEAAPDVASGLAQIPYALDERASETVRERTTTDAVATGTSKAPIRVQCHCGCLLHDRTV